MIDWLMISQTAIRLTHPKPRSWAGMAYLPCCHGNVAPPVQFSNNLISF